MKRHTYLLILLTLLAQADDPWAIALGLPSATITEAADEYLPSQPPVQGDESSPQKELAFADPKQKTSDFPRVPAPFVWNLSAPFTPPPLYLFTSLQL
jgi:hypothetical protein